MQLTHWVSYVLPVAFHVEFPRDDYCSEFGGILDFRWIMQRYRNTFAHRCLLRISCSVILIPCCVLQLTALDIGQKRSPKAPFRHSAPYGEAFMKNIPFRWDILFKEYCHHCKTTPMDKYHPKIIPKIPQNTSKKVKLCTYDITLWNCIIVEVT